jgi:outer membrane cobalamin receptor
VGRRVDSDFSSLQPPLTSNDSYTRWDVAWSYRSSYRVTYFGVIENLLNRDYMEALGFPALKRRAARQRAPDGYLYGFVQNPCHYAPPHFFS